MMACIAAGDVVREVALPSRGIRGGKDAGVLARLLLLNDANGLPLLLHLVTLPDVRKILIARDDGRGV